MRRERAYAEGLRQTPSAPWWTAERPPTPVQVEPDTMIIKRVVEKGKRTLTMMERVRRNQYQRSINHPDRWYWSFLSAAIVTGLVMSVFSVTQHIPDMPHGSYTEIVRTGGVSDYELMHPRMNRDA